MAATVCRFADPAALGVALAERVFGLAAACRGEGRRMLLGCPGGRSLKTTYDALGRLAAARGTDLSHLVVVMMDEYLWPAPGGFTPCPPDAHYSCTRFAVREIQGAINAGLPAPRRIPDDQVWLPDAADPAAYDARLAAAGGIDLFLLASGASDGHVAFNPPGTPADSPTRIVTLADTTRRDNLGTFPAFRTLDEVPRHGVSVGLGTIARLSRAVAMVLHGDHKRGAAARLLATDAFTPDWPASIVHECRNAALYLDARAAGNDHAAG